MAQQLKPDAILGTTKLNNDTGCYEFDGPEELIKVISAKLKSSKVVPPAYTNLAIALMKYANGDLQVYPTKLYETVASVENTAGYKNLGLRLTNFATDFGEILGPIWATKQKKAPKKSSSPWLQLPKEGNFSNVDFFMYGVAFSAKSGKTTNTVNLSNFATVKPETLEVKLAKIAKNNSNAVAPILVCNALIQEYGVTNTHIKKHFKKPALWLKLVKEMTAQYGDLSTLGGEDNITPSGIAILEDNSATSIYVAPTKQVPLVNGIVESVTGNKIKLKKSDARDTVSSKHRYVGLNIKKDGGREVSMIKKYSDYSLELNKPLPVKKNDLVVIFVDKTYKPTVKMVSGVAAIILESVTKESILLNYDSLMSTFADKVTFIKATLTKSKMSFTIGEISKSYLRNKNYDTRPQGIVRGGLGIQP